MSFSLLSITTQEDAFITSIYLERSIQICFKEVSPMRPDFKWLSPVSVISLQLLNKLPSNTFIQLIYKVKLRETFRKEVDPGVQRKSSKWLNARSVIPLHLFFGKSVGIQLIYREKWRKMHCKEASACRPSFKFFRPRSVTLSHLSIYPNAMVRWSLYLEKESESDRKEVSAWNPCLKW